MQIHYSDYDFLKNNPNFKIIEEYPIYFDDKTFVYDAEFLYWGLLNIPTLINTNNSESSNIKLSKTSNPILFHNINGQFTFIGLKIRFVNKQNRNFAILPIFDAAEFSFDYSTDFTI